MLSNKALLIATRLFSDKWQIYNFFFQIKCIEAMESMANNQYKMYRTQTIAHVRRCWSTKNWAQLNINQVKEFMYS